MSCLRHILQNPYFFLLVMRFGKEVLMSPGERVLILLEEKIVAYQIVQHAQVVRMILNKMFHDLDILFSAFHKVSPGFVVGDRYVELDVLNLRRSEIQILVHRITVAKME